MVIKVEVLSSFEELDVDEYCSFVGACSAPFFYDLRFIRAAERSPLIGFKKVFYLLARVDGDLVGFLPAYLQRLSDVDPLGVLSKNCGLNNDGDDLGLFSHVMHCYDSRLLSCREDTTVHAAILSAYEDLAVKHGARYFAILNVDEEPLLKVAKEYGLNVLYMVDRYYKNLEDYFDLNSVVKSFPQKGRNELRRQLRKFEADQRAEIKILMSPFDHRLEKLAELCHSTTARRGTPQFFPTHALADFVRVCDGLARLFIIEREGNLISGMICYELDDTLCLWSAGMEYHHTEFSPYTILVYSAYRYAFENGIRYIEFGRLNEKTKTRLGFYAKPMQALVSRDLKDLRQQVPIVERKYLEGSTPQYSQWYASRVWNGRDFRRMPSMVVCVKNESEVVEAINYARKNNLKVTVKTGGHSYAGSFLHNNTLLIDLANLNELEVDFENHRVTAQPGVTSQQLNEVLAEYDLAFPTGHARNVMLGGFLLGGGLGINCSQWGGMSTFNVEALEVITSDGQIRYVDNCNSPDLFWAARGAGPESFFIVTRFYLKCWKRPSVITSSVYSLSLEQVPVLLAGLEKASPQKNIQIMLAVGPKPEGGHEGLLSIIIFSNSRGDALDLRASLVSRLGRALKVVEEDQSVDFENFYKQSDDMLVSRRYRTDNILTDRGEEAFKILARNLELPHSRATVPLIIWRGEYTYPDAAFSVKGKYFISTYAQWDDQEDDELNTDWLIELYNQLGEIATGSYVNEFDLEARKENVSRCFSASAWLRLTTLREYYDQDKLFATSVFKH
ncbi:GNAT family N-acetyltransferase [Pseudomonas sp. MSSRFD41]|uniref:GNAT family N-acetyltransferase n=1 Tax=Pseudomonas sp. MSSRFD41 TaxID=1310370 RepID=UPI00163B4855|nr:GNAT family N-acetyltransferase [Pseudomonas sp. MSSRFD41]MBC2655835.1 GNAT family N-acetyltransferase [Pseudomonas sp. MSSRFD41]